MPDHCFCEAVRSQLIRQPANTISGLSFIIVAVLVWSSPNTFAMLPVYRRLYAFAAGLIGLGTMFYHASLTFWGQTADVLGMYLIATFLVLLNVARVRRLSDAALVTIYLASNAILLGGLIVLPAARRYVFAVLIVLAVSLELLARRREPTGHETRFFTAAVAVLAIGFLIWSLDITRTWCAPTSWLQGHAVWHIAGATALWLIYRSHGVRMVND
jgi:hypothetical protein